MAAPLRRLWLALAAVLLLAAPAAAHTRSETHSSWTINGGDVRLSLTVPETEAVRLQQGGEALVPDARIAAYLARHVSATNEGKTCAVAQPMRPVAATSGYRRFEAAFRCEGSDALSLHFTGFFELVSTHTNFAQVQTADGKFVEQLFDKDRQELPVTGEGAGDALSSAGFLDYVTLGVEHILSGVDHMTFLVGMVLISRRLKDLLFVVTGFTIGHSITLALAVTGLVRPHAEFIEALVALTIALIGAENIAVQTHRPGVIAVAVAVLMLALTGLKLAGIGVLPVLLLVGAGLFTVNYLMVSGHLKDGGRLRLVVTLVFGLIHGFGFAAGLLEQEIPPGKLFQLLLGFNLGVEVGQVAFVLALVGVAALLSKLKLAPPRPIVVDLAAAYLVGIGLYWFLQRSF